MALVASGEGFLREELPLVPFRQTFRKLLQAPSFTLLCLITLAVGIAASTVVFSAVNGILLNPLPYPASGRLVDVAHVAPGLNPGSIGQSEGTYVFYVRSAQEVFDGIAAYKEGSVNLTGLGGEGRPERVAAARVTASLFPVLRVSPSRGRAFSEGEDRPGGPAVVLLSDRLWHTRFGADPGIVGRTVRIDEVPHEVVGVLPPDFGFPERETDLWLPMRIDPANAPLGAFGILAVGRLAPGMSVEGAQAHLKGLLADLSAAFPGDPTAPVLAGFGFAPLVRGLRDQVVGDIGPFLWLLLGAVGLVLLIACANVGSLLLVRNEDLRRERAIRAAVGARQQDLAGMALLESVLLGLGAGVVGWVLAFWGLELLQRLGPANLPRLQEIGLNGRVLAFTAALSVVTSLLFGLIPALLAGRADLGSLLKGTGHAARLGRAQRQAQRLLVALQVALAQVVLLGSGLLFQSSQHLARLDPGFRPEGVLTAQLALPAAKYPDGAATVRLYQEVLDRIRGLSGVEAVGATSLIPLGGSAMAAGLTIEGTAEGPGTPPPIADFEQVSQDYFTALGIPVLEGRGLDRADVERPTGAVVVNRAFARQHWPGHSALGRRLRPASDDSEAPWRTVVGVVGDVHNRQLTEDPRPIVYYPIAYPVAGRVQDPETPRLMTLVVRSGLAPDTLVPLLRREVWAIDSDLPLAAVRTGDQLLSGSRARVTFSTVMFALATLVALVLAAVGIYGFVSYGVSRREPEIGVRMAIGARRRDIRRMFLREGVIIALAGIVAGALASVFAARALASLLFGVSALDPWTFATVPLLLIALVLFASYLPASRATRVDPIQSLARTE